MRGESRGCLAKSGATPRYCMTAPHRTPHLSRKAQMNMRHVAHRHNKHYISQRLPAPVIKPYKGHWRAGYGVPGSRRWAGRARTKEECVDRVQHKYKHAKGASWMPHHRNCYAEFTLRRNSGNTHLYIVTKFDGKWAKPWKKDIHWKWGYGKPGLRRYVGRTFDDKDCLKLVKKRYKNAKGVTWMPRHKNCYAEMREVYASENTHNYVTYRMDGKWPPKWVKPKAWSWGLGVPARRHYVGRASTAKRCRQVVHLRFRYARGASWNHRHHQCYAEFIMTKSDGRNKHYISRILPRPHIKKYKGSWRKGYGIPGRRYYVGRAFDQDECVDRVRRKYRHAKGASWIPRHKNCYAEMILRRNSGHGSWRVTKFDGKWQKPWKKDPHWKWGYGLPGHRRYVGRFEDDKKCLAQVKKRYKKAKGATWMPRHKNCYAEMREVYASENTHRYVTYRLDGKWPPKWVKPKTWSWGLGVPGYRRFVGRASTAKRCRQMVQMKQRYTAKGATWHHYNHHCYAELRMTKSDGRNRHYISRLLKQPVIKQYKGQWRVGYGVPGRRRLAGRVKSRNHCVDLVQWKFKKAKGAMMRGQYCYAEFNLRRASNRKGYFVTKFDGKWEKPFQKPKDWRWGYGRPGRRVLLGHSKSTEECLKKVQQYAKTAKGRGTTGASLVVHRPHRCYAELGMWKASQNTHAWVTRRLDGKWNKPYNRPRGWSWGGGVGGQRKPLGKTSTARRCRQVTVTVTVRDKGVDSVLCSSCNCATRKPTVSRGCPRRSVVTHS